MRLKNSIKLNTAVATVFFMSILTVAISMIGYRLFRNIVIERYISYTDTVLEYSYRASVKYSFGDMIAYRAMPPDYEVFREELNQIKESSDIEYLYAIYFEDIDDLHSLHYAINAKTQKELSTGEPLSEIYSYMGKPCEEGGFADDTLKILWQAVKSRDAENKILEGYSDEYGHMLNGYRVVYDSNDNAVGLICVEIDINRINIGVRQYVQTVISIAVIITAIVIILYMLTAERYLIKPIYLIAKSSNSFVKKMQENAAPDDLKYDDVCITTNGELKLLADNVKNLADGVSSYMTNLSAVTAEKERIGTELELAAKIQASMLPNIFPPFPDRCEFDIYASMNPAKEVGGDFYDFFLIDDDHLGMVMADVSGKGVPAALFMMMSKILINNIAMMGGSPAKVLEQTNAQISKNNEQEMFVTVWFGVLEISTGRITAANAGHEYPIVRKADGEFELLKGKHSFVVGGMEGVKYKEHEFYLEKGGAIFLYTDGVPEATNSDNVLFGTERLLAALNKDKNADPKALLQNVKSAVDEFVGNAEQFDDMTMLGLIYNG